MADLLSYALTTVSDVKESLGIASSDTTKDNLITRKINQATLFIESYCGLPEDHHFKTTTYTNEEYDGTGNSTIVLRMRPVTALSSFQSRDTTENENDWSDVEANIYFSDLSAGVIELNFGAGRGWNRYRVTYTAGYTTVPFDLSEAAVTLASFYVENSASGTAVKKKQEGQRSIEYFQPGGTSNITNSVIDQLGLDELLGKYMRMNIADTL